MPWTPEGHQLGHRGLTRCRSGCEVAAAPGQWWSTQNFKRRVGTTRNRWRGRRGRGGEAGLLDEAVTGLERRVLPTLAAVPAAVPRKEAKKRCRLSGEAL